MVKELFTNKPKFHLVEMCAKLFFLYIFILFETETIQWFKTKILLMKKNLVIFVDLYHLINKFRAEMD